MDFHLNLEKHNFLNLTTILCSLTTNLFGGGFCYAITSLSLEEILGKII